MRSKRAKACDISPKVRQIIHERDKGCVFCRLGYMLPPEDEFTTCTGTLQIMHYIPRSQGGLGIPENLALGCLWHHNMMDNGNLCLRDDMLLIFEEYLKAHYESWDKEKLFYSKW